MNERWGGFNDDEDAVVVAVAEPVELHQLVEFTAFSSISVAEGR